MLTNKSIYCDNRNNYIYYDSEYNTNSKVNFKGKNNILFLDKNAKIQNTNITFSGDNSLIFLGNSLVNKANINVFNNSVVYIGNNNYFNPAGGGCSLLASEEQNIIIGNSCLFSFDIWFRTADPHLIFDCKTNMRVNFSKSIFIGDHVWCGQEVGFAKGVFVASGSVVGAKSMLAGKILRSNTINAGNPCKEIKENIYWSRECVHAWTTEQTSKYTYSNNDNFKFIFSKKDFVNLYTIDTNIKKLSNSKDKLFFVYNKIHLNRNKNRFSLNSFSQISNTKIYGAKKIILEGYRYEIGDLLVRNRFSLLLPFIVIKCIKKYNMCKKENKIIENDEELKKYDDYIEAIKIKKHLRYRIGHLFLDSYKNRYRGGMIMFVFKVYKLVKEFRNK
ncbi:TPA: hypothetical protein R1763_001065 [Campylobacter lari]|uniref:acyltransferase n=1 Tax=Campylobacter sp. IFREMER_LSEM_CL1890 TaxID=2911615 RepID=UPI0021E6D573|nr:hypothetical protein [Campylobacter sp. IFREMER_LSEM_CL1890]MCV3409612.1 hypothetical protein [Campylobacter sp. IFREMER_LSEM_CL1890]HEC1797635.1 hypothetical protein [Campylobacter lari]